jgi:hypothetical protein
MTCASRTARIYHDVWYGADNAFTLALIKVSPDGVRSPADLTTALSMELTINGSTLVVNANDPGAPIDWWSVDAMSGEVTFQLGQWAALEAIPAGTYPARLTVVDPIHPNGTVWLSESLGELMVRVHTG